MSEDIFYKSVVELSEMLASGEISAVELAKAFIERKNSVDDKVGAFISCDEKSTLSAAEKSDARRAKGGSLGVLDGIPVGLKDLLAVRGQPLTCASRMLEKYVSPYTGTAMAKLVSSGAGFWGRLNMDDFAKGSSSESTQPVDFATHTRRQQRRFRSCGGSGRMRLQPGQRHWRIYPPAGVPLRHRGNEAHIRVGEPFRLGGICVVARPDRAVCALS